MSLGNTQLDQSLNQRLQQWFRYT